MLNGSRTKAAPPASRRLALPPRHRRLPRPRPCRSKRHHLRRRQPLRASCSDSKTTCSESIERSRRSHARLAAVPMRRGTRNCQRSNSSSGRSRTSKGRSEHSRDRVTRRGWILFVAMALIWGIPYLFIKIAVTELSPASLVLFRTAIGTVLLLPLAAARKDLAPVLKHWKWILIYTAAEVAAPWLLLSDAEQRISSSLAGLLLAATPSFGAILAWATGGHDRLDRRRIIGLAIGFVGVGALVGLDIRTNDVGAIGEALLVAVGYATGATIISRKLSTLPSLGVVVASLAITALVYAPIGIAQLPSSLPAPSVVFAVAVLGVVCTAIAFIMFFALIREVGSARATVITYLNPAVALALGIAVLGEPLTLGILIGFVLIVLGSVLATRPGAAPPTSVPVTEERTRLVRSSQ